MALKKGSLASIMDSLPSITDENRTPLVENLLSIIMQQQKQIEVLQAEINRLKKHKGKPKLKASTLGKNNKGNNNNQSGRGKLKKSKSGEIIIDKVQIIDIDKDKLPDGAEFKGYNSYIVQDLEIKTVNTQFKLAHWILPNGGSITASLPDEYIGYHFGPTLRSYVLHQHHHQNVTQPLLLDQLREFGVIISSGQLSNLLIHNKENFHQEKREVLVVGLKHSKYIQADDTGARHNGKNGVCTHIGNESFAFFESTSSKSRINFLKLLHCGEIKYCLDLDVVELAKENKYNHYECTRLGNRLLQTQGVRWFSCEDELKLFLSEFKFDTPGRFRYFCEWCLLRSLEEQFGYKKMALVTDEAGQFDFPLFAHGLCWIHVDRKINKLVPCTSSQTKQLTSIRKRFWNLYDSLKKYKLNPTLKSKKRIEINFNRLINTNLDYVELEEALQRIGKLKAGLLLVLERPDIPLHNNASENDIREYVKKRKVSGSTRSEEGRRCRDTFASLKKTCKKQGVKFWHFLQDRVSGKNEIKQLSVLVEQSLKSQPP